MKTNGYQILAAVFVLAGTTLHASAQQTRLTMTSLSPAKTPNSKYFNEWAERVNKASDGTLRIVVRDGTTLANFRNSYDRTMSDAVQIGWAIHGLVAGKFPKTAVSGLPFLSDDNGRCSATLWKLYKSGLVDSEYKDVVPIMFACLGSAGLHFNRKPASITDLSGMKIRVNGKEPSELVRLLGGASISLPGGAMYEALQRRTIDGIVTSWSAFAPYKLQEVTNYHIEVPIGQSSSMFFMSKKKFDALPEKARKALLDNGGEKQSIALGQFFGGQGDGVRAAVVKSGKHEIVKPTPDQEKVWRDKVAGLHADWAKSVPDGGKLIDTYRSLYAETK
ncbi:MAG: TRAP transporter substrate-binding protein DctP [Beijerinckiaceae bacterium]